MIVLSYNVFINLWFTKISCHYHLLLASIAVRMAGWISVFTIAQPFHIVQATLDKESVSLHAVPLPTYLYIRGRAIKVL